MLTADVKSARFKRVSVSFFLSGFSPAKKEKKKEKKLLVKMSKQKRPGKEMTGLFASMLNDFTKRRGKRKKVETCPKLLEEGMPSSQAMSVNKCVRRQHLPDFYIIGAQKSGTTSLAVRIFLVEAFSVTVNTSLRLVVHRRN